MIIPSNFFHIYFSSNKYNSPYFEDKLTASFFLYVPKHEGIFNKHFIDSLLTLILIGSITTEISGI